MTSHPPTFLGVDLGTSALKVVAVSADGALLGAARREYQTHRPEPTAAEQDPRHWWSALESALNGLAHDVPPASWAGLGLSAMLPTLVELDGDDVPLSPAITWEDARAEADAKAFLDAVGAEEVYRITGQRLDGRYLAPMHARLRRLGLAGSTVAGAKDVLFAHLTGELLTDPSTAAGTGVFDLDADCWNTELVAASGIPRLPELAPATTARPLQKKWCDRWGVRPGMPVVLGAADSVLGAIGMGATSVGDVAVIAGTSAIVLGLSDKPVRDRDRRYLVTPMAGAGWGLEMDVLSVGSAFGGIARLLGLPGPAALVEAATHIAHDAAPTFLPYLTPGEQGALWDPNLTGSLHGLTLAMGPGHVGRALVSGVVVELRRCVNILDAATGHRGPILMGGGAAGPLVWQDLADATGRDVHVDLDVDDPSAFGAAMMAAGGVGETVAPSGSRTTVTPNPGAATWWTDAAARHDALRCALDSMNPP